jgi:ankyrin repeat protein
MRKSIVAALLVLLWLPARISLAQTPPGADEVANYAGLHAAAHHNDAAAVRRLVAAGADPNLRDNAGRTPVHIAAHAAGYKVLRALVANGADINAQDHEHYDVITIVAVMNDVRMVKIAIGLGGNPKAVTSPYEGTALIAAAHLGYVDVVKALISAGAPLDHLNNLGWTALLEAIILGDGGERHIETVKALVDAGVDKTIPDRDGTTPLQHAQRRGYAPIISILK